MKKNINENMFNKNLEHDLKYKNILGKYGIKENEIKETMNKMYDSSSKEYTERKELFKRCAELCINNNDCKNSFKPTKYNGITYKTDFFIIESTRENGSNNEELYSFIINSPSKEEVIHASTFKKVIDKNNKIDYVKCNEYIYNSIKYGTIVNKNQKYNKKITHLRKEDIDFDSKYINPQYDEIYKNNYGINSDGIGIIAEAEINIAKNYKSYINPNNDDEQLNEYSYKAYYGSEDYKYDDKESLKNYTNDCKNVKSERCEIWKKELNIQKIIVEKYGKCLNEMYYMNEINTNYYNYNEWKKSYEENIKLYNDIRGNNKEIEKYENFEKDYNDIKESINKEIEEKYGQNDIEYVINKIKEDCENQKKEIFEKVKKRKQ